MIKYNIYFTDDDHGIVGYTLSYPDNTPPIMILERFHEKGFAIFPTNDGTSYDYINLKHIKKMTLTLFESNESNEKD